MTDERPAVLLVGRQADGAGGVAAALRERGWDVVLADDAGAALEALDARAFDGVVTALESGAVDGMAVLRRSRERHPDAWVVMVADAVPGGRVVEALRAGAADVVSRPDPEQIAAVLERGLAHQRMARRLAHMEEHLDERFGIDRLAGRSRAIARVTDQIRQVAASRGTVLIEGEPGTGKGLVARIIHQRGPRRAARFVWASCAALTPELAAAELFGEEGPGLDRPGRVELADRGTLLLEEIDALPAAGQVRLLRFLQDRTFERVGSRETRRSDARLIVSSPRDLAGEVRAGRFREDLFVRLSAVRIAIPPLRERPEDLAPLVTALLGDLAREHGRGAARVTPGVMERFARHDWPGNARELRNVLEAMVVFGGGSGRGARRRPLDVGDLPPAWRDAIDPQETLRIPVGTSLAEVERRLIEATMRHARQDKPRAAAMLGMGLRTLYRKLDALGMRGREPAGRGREQARRGPKPGGRRRR
jgi:DNA-binding NtrC family response regulator